jgi:hypothetical protein
MPSPREKATQFPGRQQQKTIKGAVLASASNKNVECDCERENVTTQESCLSSSQVVRRVVGIGVFMSDQPM